MIKDLKNEKYNNRGRQANSILLILRPLRPNIAPPGKILFIKERKGRGMMGIIRLWFVDWNVCLSSYRMIKRIKKIFIYKVNKYCSYLPKYSTLFDVYRKIYTPLFIYFFSLFISFLFSFLLGALQLTDYSQSNKTLHPFFAFEVKMSTMRGNQDRVELYKTFTGRQYVTLWHI